MAIWEWVGEITISKSLDVQQCLPADPGSYGPQVIYDRKKPDTIKTFRAHGVARSEWEPWQTAAGEPFGSLELTDNTGATHEGLIASLAIRSIPGTVLADVEVGLRSEE